MPHILARTNCARNRFIKQFLRVDVTPPAVGSDRDPTHSSKAHPRHPKACEAQTCDPRWNSRDLHAAPFSEKPCHCVTSTGTTLCCVSLVKEQTGGISTSSAGYRCRYFTKQAPNQISPCQPWLWQSQVRHDNPMPSSKSSCSEVCDDKPSTKQHAHKKMPDRCSSSCLCTGKILSNILRLALSQTTWQRSSLLLPPIAKTHCSSQEAIFTLVLSLLLKTVFHHPSLVPPAEVVRQNSYLPGAA